MGKPNAEDAFDAELEAMLNPEAPEDATPEKEPTQAEEKIKAAGREYTRAEIAKAHTHITKEYTKTRQAYKKHEPWIKFSEQLDAHPELRDSISKKIEEYNARRAAGQSQTTAKEESGVSKVMADRLEKLEAAHADDQLDREMSSVRTKYSLNADQERELLEKAEQVTEKFGNVPLEMVWRDLMFDKHGVNNAAAGESKAAKDAAAKVKANVGGSDAQSARPTPKDPATMTDTEHRAAVDAELIKYGIE